MQGQAPSPHSCPSPNPTPDPILIIGAGIFGLSTALSLLHRQPRSHIHILDAHPLLPNPTAASVDTSRIIRSDYASPVYARLAAEAQEKWRRRDEWCQRGMYVEGGLVIVADRDPRSEEGEEGVGDDQGDRAKGWRYMNSVLANVRSQANSQSQGNGQGADVQNGKEKREEEEERIQELPTRTSITRVSGYAGAMGDLGYVNRNSGWADAGACVTFALESLRREEERVKVQCGAKVERLLFSEDEAETKSEPDRDCTQMKARSGPVVEEKEEKKKKKKKTNRCTGVLLSTGQVIHGSLIILAAGAWTPTLIDLRGRATATGQVLAYLPVTAEEVRGLRLAERAVVMNVSRGTYLIPPKLGGPAGRERVGEKGGGEVKVARHGYGYVNLNKVKAPSLLQFPPAVARKGRDDGSKLSGEEGEEATAEEDEETITISVPKTGIPIPYEGEQVCREMIREAFSSSDSELESQLAERSFSRTRVCWYCDTPTTDFLISYHPHASNLFIATGGSGHGFKFFPVIGDKIVDAIDGCLEPELRALWRWREEAVAEGFEVKDESRGESGRGMALGVARGREEAEGRKVMKLGSGDGPVEEGVVD